MRDRTDTVVVVDDLVLVYLGDVTGWRVGIVAEVWPAEFHAADDRVVVKPFPWSFKDRPRALHPGQAIPGSWTSIRSPHDAGGLVAI